MRHDLIPNHSTPMSTTDRWRRHRRRCRRRRRCWLTCSIWSTKFLVCSNLKNFQWNFFRLIKRNLFRWLPVIFSNRKSILWMRLIIDYESQTCSIESFDQIFQHETLSRVSLVSLKTKAYRFFLFIWPPPVKYSASFFYIYYWRLLESSPHSFAFIRLTSSWVVRIWVFCCLLFLALTSDSGAGLFIDSLFGPATKS